MPSTQLPSSSECIRLRGARQNNLKGFDLDLPLGQYIAVTGLSGAGKSSLVFDTLHAEGQRRYVETFSAYTRQFLDLLEKPHVDSIENIRPSIAIEQKNTVKTSRSTVGTMTELCDFFKVWFAHVAELIDPETGKPIHDDNPQSIWKKASRQFAGETLLPAFEIPRPANIEWDEIIRNVQGQGYTRVAIAGKICRLEHADEQALSAGEANATTERPGLAVIQDRVKIDRGGRRRFLEAVETALHFGHGQVLLLSESGEVRARYSRGLRSPETGREYRAATAGLFSFNSPLGACPKCRGFGRIIEIDYRLAIPDTNLSIKAGAIRPFEGQVYSESRRDLIRAARRLKIRTDVPYSQLTSREHDLIMNGEPAFRAQKARGEDYDYGSGIWYGLKGFFNWLESNTYKMHVRVFLSRYRAYVPCPECGGSRLQPEALCWRWRGHTLPELYQFPVSDLLALLASDSTIQNPKSEISQHPATIAFDSILTRLTYLEQVGLGYLTLDRSSRTLSGGEVERVNLTSCLGTSLVDTLFVLDEPSVGLHARDIDRLIQIIRSLTAAGNTVVVVEHDEAMIRAADHVIEVGPEPGAAGGQIVFQGTVAQMVEAPASITGDYFSGRRELASPELRRPVTVRGQTTTPCLHFRGATKHNLENLDLRVPLQRFVGLSGVSGSGKSTLLDNVIYQGLLQHRGLVTDDPAKIESISSDLSFSEVVLVDQSPVSRTPRSNPAVYTEAWDEIRMLFAATPAAMGQGFTPSDFSFNSGNGRCEHCQGLGYERVEMQFLSDVFLPCSNCDGRRFKDNVLAIRWNELSIADTLHLTVAQAIEHFGQNEKITNRLCPLIDVGLGYLQLGQPLNTLSGGESQRLKLVKYLGTLGTSTPTSILHPQSSIPPGALLLLDEPTTGLHRHDVKRLIDVLQKLVAEGHSLVVIEHNVDVLKSADWLIEIGPGAGAAGGRIVAEGPPETIAAAAVETAPFLRAALPGSESREPFGRKRSAHARRYKAHVGAASAAINSATTDGSRLKPLLHVAETQANFRPTIPRSPTASTLTITGARENNLKDLSVEIPHRELSVVTGVSGSGKSTLAFDIVFAEGQRRFMESMSPYARQFVEQMPRPHIDRLTGIPPTVAIEQRVTRGSRKSTVATITEVAQYLRLLYARVGLQHHPDTGQPVLPHTEEELLGVLRRMLRRREVRRAGQILLLAPLVRGRKGHHQPLANWAINHGYERLRIDGRVLLTDRFQKLDRYREHDIEVVVADLRLLPSKPDLLRAKLREALRLGKGACLVMIGEQEIAGWLSTSRTDLETGDAFPELDPKHFSFNSPRGWCPACRGHGRIHAWMLQREDDELPPEIADLAHSLDEVDALAGKQCPECRGARLNRVSRAVKMRIKRGGWLSLPDLLRATPDDLIARLRNLDLDRRGQLIAADIIPQVEERLKYMGRVGLGYLTLDRATETLSGGEAQRIRLAAQLGTNLAGVLYVLDEPSIGLHARDNDQLIETLIQLRDKGNTLLVVEHDDAMMERADRIIDLGPGAGIQGGHLLANGKLRELKKNPESITGRYLNRQIPHPLLGTRRPLPPRSNAHGWIELSHARFRNLRDVSLRIPVGRLTMVAGVSGAGKSTLVRDILGNALQTALKQKKHKLTGRQFTKARPEFASEPIAVEPDSSRGRRRLSGLGEAGSRPSPPFAELRLPKGFRSVIEVDQSPIGKTPRSTPATYLGAFDLIRQFFASLPEARIRGYNAGRFSFNTAGGRCETCSGAGRIKLEMNFLPDTYLPCEDCGGSRYGPDLADITWKGKSVADVLALSFDEAAQFFDFHATLQETMQLMVDTGLGYLTLGQSSPTLSGGEAQRLKLVTELTRGLRTYTERSRGEQPRNVYILEEPTIGLHLSDCEKLIRVLHRLVDQGHTVIVIEHQVDLLAEADYIVEVGPDGGPAGGRIVYQGAVSGLLRKKSSPTAPYLRVRLQR